MSVMTSIGVEFEVCFQPKRVIGCRKSSDSASKPPHTNFIVPALAQTTPPGWWTVCPFTGLNSQLPQSLSTDNSVNKTVRANPNVRL